jgi:hypothetical protein
MDLTPEQLAAIEQRAAKATLHIQTVRGGNESGRLKAPSGEWQEFHHVLGLFLADCERSIADIPALTAALRRAWEERDAMREAAACINTAARCENDNEMRGWVHAAVDALRST